MEFEQAPKKNKNKTLIAFAVVLVLLLTIVITLGRITIVRNFFTNAQTSQTESQSAVQSDIFPSKIGELQKEIIVTLPNKDFGDPFLMDGGYVFSTKEVLHSSTELQELIPQFSERALYTFNEVEVFDVADPTRPRLAQKGVTGILNTDLSVESVKNWIKDNKLVNITVDSSTPVQLNSNSLIFVESYYGDRYVKNSLQRKHFSRLIEISAGNRGFVQKELAVFGGKNYSNQSLDSRFAILQTKDNNNAVIFNIYEPDINRDRKIKTMIARKNSSGNLTLQPLLMNQKQLFLPFIDNVTYDLNGNILVTSHDYSEVKTSNNFYEQWTIPSVTILDNTGVVKSHLMYTTTKQVLLPLPEYRNTVTVREDGLYQDTIGAWHTVSLLRYGYVEDNMYDGIVNLFLGSAINTVKAPYTYLLQKTNTLPLSSLYDDKIIAKVPDGIATAHMNQDGQVVMDMKMPSINWIGLRAGKRLVVSSENQLGFYKYSN